MADGTFPGLVSRSRDLNSSSNVIFNQLADDAGNVVTVTGGKLDVNADVTVDSDQIFVDDSAFTVAVDHVSAQGMLADETAPDSVDEGDIGIPRMTLDRKQLNVIVDPTTDANRLAINADGSINLGSQHIEDTPHVTADVGIMPLAVRNDGTAALAGDGDYIPLTTNNRGFLYVGGNIVDDAAWGTGGDTVQVSGFIFDDVSPDSVDEGDAGYARMTSTRQQLVTVADPITTSRRLAIETAGTAKVRLWDTEGSNASGGNQARPINSNPVAFRSSQYPNLASHMYDFQTTASLASDATTNHDFVAAAFPLLTSLVVSASGQVKFEIYSGAAASEETNLWAVGFLTGRQGDTQQITFPLCSQPDIAYGHTVRIKITNRQGQAQDVYSTLMGMDIY